MKLTIALLVIFAVSGWIGGTPSVNSMNNFYQETWTLKSADLLYMTPTELYLIKDLNFSKIVIIDSSNFSGINKFDDNDFNNIKFTINCATNNIYILKKSKKDKKKILDVIHYNDNNEFKRIKQISNMFNNAISISSDYKTGNIYWIELNSKKKYSIKVTNKSFKKPKYIIKPVDYIHMSVIHLYPKQDELFFASNKLWYYSNYSTSFNKRPKGLFDEFRNERFIDFSIDYGLDKLCWIALNAFPYTDLNCVDISTFKQSISTEEDTFLVYQIPYIVTNLAVFNNTFYWTAYDENNKGSLFFYNGIDEPVKLADSNQEDQFSFLSSKCFNKK